ncbi:DUF983 domain-containing protein [Dyadobacter luteus]|jgi:uncharacterized protein (DUF983 family)|uniref:DUF983 domain-containing protein n=1 Tax=Dyadobacter luteus TaxID=2259619 RepID=A0A3D8Y6L2_9BACT|nr:DUF983 domain-containing protein [Dyadobacter luteus]REA58519.1 DUF983 domain-containing protein [Dyadobacter luteus]
MSKLYSISRLKCPRCHKGDLFIKSNPYSFKGALDMPDRCPKCDQDFKMEPGFYIGALWTSFPIVIIIMALLSILLLVYVRMDMNLFFVVITLLLFSLQPIIIRVARAIWINIFVDYQN